MILDPASATPLYVQLMELLKRQIGIDAESIVAKISREIGEALKDR